MRAIVLIFLFAGVLAAQAISEGEKTALNDLLRNFPHLGFLSPPWASNTSAVCGNPPFQGLECSDGPEKHILSLQIDDLSVTASLPESIGELSWLRNLSVAVNTLTAIPESLNNLRNLEYLALFADTISIEQAPINVGSLLHLLSMNLRISGSARPLPDGISNLKKMTSLSLSGAFSGLIPSSFCDLDNLTDLRLSMSNLSGFDACSGRLKNLVTLQLHVMPKLDIPLDSILSGRLKLVELDVSLTPIYGSLEFADQRNLEILSLSSTHISGPISHSLWANKKLRSIYFLSPNIYGTISSEIGELGNLQNLNLAFNEITGTLPPEIGLCTSLKSLNLHTTRLSGTIPPEMGNLHNLRQFSLSSKQINGSIPNSFSKLQSLVGLGLDGCNLVGTLPSGLMMLPKLKSFNANANRLNGTLPNASPSLTNLDLSDNLLTGTLPASLLTQARTIRLSKNRLSGSIPPFGSQLVDINLSNNLLEGSLPSFVGQSEPTVEILDLSSNRLSGTIPSQYLHYSIRRININNNELEGSTVHILENNNTNTIDLGHNKFTGTITSSIGYSFDEIRLSNNFISGNLPTFPPKLKRFFAAKNALSGNLNSLTTSKTLEMLDLSHNNLGGSVPNLISLSYFTFLALASNRFSGSLNPATYNNDGSIFRLQSLDLSNNFLVGEFPFYQTLHSPISSILLANNSLSGKLDYLPPQLAILDVSDNLFEFDITPLPPHAYLSYLSAQNNYISGTLSLSGMTSLKSANLQGNRISQIDFHSISSLSIGHKLAQLSILNNPITYIPEDFDQLVKSGDLIVTSTSTPSQRYPGVVCSYATFGKHGFNVFEYDESIFSYQQCECDRDHYGFPPTNCFRCDGVGSNPANCSGYYLDVGPNFFMFDAPDPINPLQTESCVDEGYEVVRKSNCIGIKLKLMAEGALLFDWHTGAPIGEKEPNPLSSSLLANQCQTGSSGRLCSKCDCDLDSLNGACYYSGPGNICKKCGSVLRPSVYVPVTISVLFIIMIALSIIFYFILRSKRQLKDTKWENLSLGKRFLYRLINMTSFGQITILVTFIQILVEVTHWDAYALNSWLKIANGESEGLGLRCIFPFLSKPVNLLLLRLFLPMIAIAIIGGSICIGDLIYRLAAKFRRKRPSNTPIEYGVDLTPAEDEVALLQAQKDADGFVHYPVWALVSSVSISIIKFFYFGATLAAFEYLFYSVQKGTKRKFVQSVPWMEFGDAHILRSISIPFIIVFLLGIPSAFVLVCWKLRHKIWSPSIQSYFGSAFENYESHLFWWELVNIFKKISIALVLRWLPTTNAWQPVVTSSIILLLAIATMKLRPWKVELENLSEGIGAVLIVLSLASARLGDLSGSHSVIICLVALTSTFAALLLIVIIWRACMDETGYEKQWKLRFEAGWSDDS